MILQNLPAVGRGGHFVFEIFLPNGLHVNSERGQLNPVPSFSSVAEISSKSHHDFRRISCIR